MNIIEIKFAKLKTLKPLHIEKGVFNSEAYMLILTDWFTKGKIKESKVFKYLDCQDDKEKMDKKKNTIMSLDSSHPYKNIKELIIPDTCIKVEGKEVGFAMEMVNNHRNVGHIINNDDIPLNKKIGYLYEMGRIISKVQNVKDQELKINFGDLNEYNFILNSKNEMRVIDLDSSHVKGTIPTDQAYYLLNNKYINKIKEKYKRTKEGIIIPNDNSDLYCYNMILLSVLAKDSVFKEDISTYYAYINYLKTLGISNELINSFYNIYLPANNINPMESLETINTRREEEYTLKTFKKKVKKY